MSEERKASAAVTAVRKVEQRMIECAAGFVSMFDSNELGGADWFLDELRKATRRRAELLERI